MTELPFTEICVACGGNVTLNLLPKGAVERRCDKCKIYCVSLPWTDGDIFAGLLEPKP